MLIREAWSDSGKVYGCSLPGSVLRAPMHCRASVSNRMKRDLAIRALNMAIAFRAPQATARPKTQAGSSEMIIHVEFARDTAVKSRSQAMVTLTTLIMKAPADLRDALDQIQGKIALIRHIAAFRPGDIDNALASEKAAMRTLARRWLWLQKEILSHDKETECLVTKRAPDLLATLTVAAMLIMVGDDPTRLRL